ncbi:methylenetetrahydrofolate reductase C-terminal domain-containing protein [Williamsia deligens]|uniref:Methylenetetrahydrofolate reductase n=1 Tax=Williamsia deligens TaxID=321325 RepID=A0ABW3GA90_9NOCA|nr:methylenetetrahydrofolate reductase C-terminal domain-containing protein [Williamsia deligens]MCP2193569.1 5,10-methylenetetrahydrofolate reductase [Williamsia deligens]
MTAFRDQGGLHERQQDPTGHPRPGCPKRMVYGPCGGVHDDGSCEVDSEPCPFAAMTEALPWPTPAVGPTSRSDLLRRAQDGPVVLADFSAPAFDVETLARVCAIMAGSSDAVLVGEHQSRPDFPPTLMAQFISETGCRPWITLTCRDRNRVVLEQELAGLRSSGADGVFCATGDGRAPGVRAGVTQVFDLDGTRLAALAAAAGLPVGVPEAPQAVPTAVRPGRLLQKQRAGAQLAVLNHVGTAAQLSDFVAAAQGLGVDIPIIAGVAVYSDERSANVLAAFPGLHLSRQVIDRVLSAPDPVEAGIAAAVEEANEVLSIDGVVGVNLSGMAAGTGAIDGARIKAEVGTRIRDGHRGARRR